jgi:tetratricopeptide (TPR) repeat protein
MSSSLPSPNPEQRHTAAVQFERANQLLANGQPDAALALLLPCCRADPGNLIYRQRLRHAQRARLGHRPRRNTSRFAGLLTWLPRRRLRAAHQSGDTVKVLQLAEEVCCLDPWNVETHVLMSEIFAAAGTTDAAIWCLEQAHEAAPHNPEVVEQLARLYEQRGNFTFAKQLRNNRAGDLPAEDTVVGLRAQIAGEPGNPQPYLDLAQLYRGVGRLDMARPVLQQGLTATRYVFALGLALAQLDIEPFRRDLAIAEEKLTAEPHSASLLALRDRLLAEINTREIGLYQQLGDRFPDDMAHRFELGVRLLKAGQFDEALAAFESARADERYRWRALVHAGYCHLNRRKWRQAALLFEEALPLLPAGEEATRRELLALLASHGRPSEPRAPGPN